MAARSEQVAQGPRLETEQRVRRFDVAERPLQFEVIPIVCLVSEVCHFLRISPSQFHRLMARKALALVELEPLDSTRRFTGESVKREIERRSGWRVR
jgi:hypothetical protein